MSDNKFSAHKKLPEVLFWPVHKRTILNWMFIQQESDCEVLIVLQRKQQPIWQKRFYT